jgi:Cu2+-containing amine oxidase
MTAKDFWITVQEPQSALRRRMNENRNAYRSEKGMSERRCSDVPSAVSRYQENLRNRPLVVWHQSAFLHVPRKEDFGTTAADPHAALTAWRGFDLVPRNMWESTPFIRPPPQ